MPSTSPPCPRAAFWAWGLAAAAFVLAAFCLASLTFDGSYYLLRTLQEGAPIVPHRRWLNELLLAPVLWARPWAGGPAALAVLHGLLCSLAPLLSLAACLSMLRGKWAPLRLWALFGILLAPLPGQILLVGEVTPAIQLGWVGLVFVWRGCPWRWAPVALLSGAAMWGLHPVSAPLFFYVAATAAALAFATDGRDRGRLALWSALFGLAALGKAAEVALYASAYERANLHGAAWASECFTGFLMTPFVALLPAFLDAGLAFRDSWRGRASSAGFSRFLWGAAFVFGLAYSLYPGGWTGALCYRKFGILLVTPVALMGGAEAWRLWRGGSLPARGAGLILRPALLFAVMLGGMSLSWQSLCRSFTDRLAACPGPIQMHEELSPLERESALNHWSATSLSLLLQGWSPHKVHVWNGSLQRAQTGFCVCPEEDFVWNDRAVKLAWIGKLALP